MTTPLEAFMDRKEIKEIIRTLHTQVERLSPPSQAINIS